MKKLLLTLTLGLMTLLVTAQTYYLATLTELYTYNDKNKEWELYQKMSDVKINVVVEDEFVSFQAKTPTFYKIYNDTKEDIGGESFQGYRYKGLDLKTNEKCYIDICRFKSSSYMISVVKPLNYNLRYYLTIE